MDLLAWLHTPADKKDDRTRQDRFGSVIEMPEVECDYMIAWLFECGPCGSNGYGAVSIQWNELKAWIEITGRAVSHWEACLIHRMSRIYANGLSEYRHKQIDAPQVEQD